MELDMYARVGKAKVNKRRAVGNSVTQKKSNVPQRAGFVDNRQKTIPQKKMRETTIAARFEEQAGNLDRSGQADNRRKELKKPSKQAEETVQRAKVEIGAGTFEDEIYIPINEGLKFPKKGAKMQLTFMPDENLDATEVSLVQTTNSTIKNETTKNVPDQTESLLDERRTAAGSAIDQQIFLPEEKNLFGTVAKPKRTNLDPRYHEERSSTEEPLANPRGKPSAGQAAIKREGKWRKALLKDAPGQSTKPNDKLTGAESFEVAAMADASRFIGSIRWGWKVNADNKAELDPTELTLVSDSSASAEFSAAAAAWNEMEVKDDSGKHKVMQLPTSPAWKAFAALLKTFDPDTKPTTVKVNELVELGLKMSKEEKLLVAKGTPHFNLRNYLYGSLNLHVIEVLS